MTLSWHGDLLPQLSVTTQALFRTGYGILLLGTLVLALPHHRRFFVSERWSGYAQSSPATDAIQNPLVCPVILAGWLLCGVCIAWGRFTVAASAINLLCCRYFFVQMRWKGVLRGMGAPGFLTYWLAAAVFLLEFSTRYAPAARPLALLALHVDFAVIILSAGVYKLTAGYAQHEGMELGLVNPEWGYWGQAYGKLAPRHWIFAMLNHLAWGTEVAAALLMLLPPTRAAGGLLLIVSFAFIATQIRLGLLCEMVMLCGVLYIPEGSLGDRWLRAMLPAAPPLAADGGVGLIAAGLTAVLWVYLALLPFAHAGLWYNLYAKRRLRPAIAQRWLEVYTNFFGMIIWRVFSVDLVNFFIRIYRQPRAGGRRDLVTVYGWRGGLRYSHVGECITLTSVFTTLKYYPGDTTRFHDRLLRYARTVPCPPEAVLVFEYVSIRKDPTRFAFVPVAEYEVDLTIGRVAERVLLDAVSVKAAHPSSPVHAALRPGSYAPDAR